MSGIEGAPLITFLFMFIRIPWPWAMKSLSQHRALLPNCQPGGAEQNPAWSPERLCDRAFQLRRAQGVLFGWDREGITSSDSQRGLRVWVQISYFKGGRGNWGTWRLNNWLRVTQQISPWVGAGTQVWPPAFFLLYQPAPYEQGSWRGIKPRLCCWCA